jgi:epoxyqueuosine reductase
VINISAYIKGLAKEEGFMYCGIAKAMRLEEDERRLALWLQKGMQGKMAYMENHFDLRVDPTKLVAGAKSVITFLMNYFPSEQQLPEVPKIARYAWGEDYHEVIRAKLKTIMTSIETTIGEINGRGFVDSAPVLERAWALRSGLGWVGKNGNLITKSAGSYFFIATLITDLAMDYDDPYNKDYCGSCNRCVEACPTEAILPGKVIDGSRCISYFTIELKDAVLPDEMSGKFGDWMFGCDICQEVCPWNRFAEPHMEEKFQPIPDLLSFTQKDWEALTEEGFKKTFKHSPLKRTKFSGIQRNVKFLKK